MNSLKLTFHKRMCQATIDFPVTLLWLDSQKGEFSEKVKVHTSEPTRHGTRGPNLQEARLVAKRYSEESAAGRLSPFSFLSQCLINFANFDVN